MRLRICAVGRMRAGPEKTLVDDYVMRAGRSGRALGLGPVEISEVDDRKGGGSQAEEILLRKSVPKGAVLCCLDERGKTLSSPDLADRLARWRDSGQPEVAFVIGGADGLAPDLVAEADLSLSFGRMVWPHMLARVMLAEQLYRATSILAGAPYHRA
ncbi:MAG: 23S rRNA (pseudouridine(1915)-N(3))-methyltransferase RlmH [Pseudomonadota bacterium]